MKVRIRVDASGSPIELFDDHWECSQLDGFEILKIAAFVFHTMNLALKLPTQGVDYCPSVQVVPFQYTLGVMIVTHAYLFTVLRLLPPAITKRHATAHLESSHPRHTNDPVIVFLFLLPGLLVQLAYPMLFVVSTSACLQWGAAGYMCFIWFMRSLDLCFSWPDILEVDPKDGKEAGPTIPFTWKYYLAHMCSHPDYAHLAAFHEKHRMDAVTVSVSEDVLKSSTLQSQTSDVTSTEISAGVEIKKKSSRPSRSYTISFWNALSDMTLHVVPRVVVAEALYHYGIPSHEKLLQEISSSWTDIPFLGLPFNPALHKYAGIQAMVFFLFQSALADLVFHAVGVFIFGMKVKSFHPRHRKTHHRNKSSQPKVNGVNGGDRAPPRSHLAIALYDLVDIMFYPLTASR